jgi:superfamily II DNA or RNA helicase
MANKLKDELQSKALKEFIKAGSRGTIVLETGSGKSKVSIDFIKTLQPTTILITSPRTNLKNNWRDELIKWGLEPWRDSIWTYNGVRHTIIIENIQTCYKWTENKFGLIIMDEIHTMMTPEYSKLLQNNETMTLMGLTATPDIYPDNDKQYYYKKYCPIIFEYYNSAEDGLINKTRFFIVNHDLSNDDRIITTHKGKTYEKGELEFYEYLTESMKRGQGLMMKRGSMDWFSDASRWLWQGKGTPEQKGAAAVYMNAIKARKNFLLNLPSTGKIAKQISGGIRAEFPKAKVLVFSELTAQADKISKITVHSHHSTKANTKSIEDFNTGSIKELGSCNSLTLGLNLVGATHAVMESYIGSATKSKQKKGRLDRLASDEHADMWIIRVPGTQSDKWFGNMTKKFDLSEAVYLNSDFILRNDFDFRKSEIKTKVSK